MRANLLLMPIDAVRGRIVLPDDIFRVELAASCDMEQRPRSGGE